MRVPPPGQLVSVGTHHLHINCQGSGSPAVILDAALGASSVSWTLVQPGIARLTQTCAYDRAGLGWSEAGPLPRTAGRAADELRVLLDRAGVSPPYVLVGHSFGAFVQQVFAARYRTDTAGLVLFDPPATAEWLAPAEHDRRQMERGVRLCGHGALAARLGIARAVAALVGIGALGPARAAVRAVSRGGLRRQDEAILAPVWKLPPEARRPLREFWTQERFYQALGSQIGAICESAAEVRQAMQAGYGNVPLLVVSSTDPEPTRRASHEGLTALSARGRHIIASSSGHWIPLDQPQLVIEAVVAMVVDVRRNVQ
jgi:pimeloyl-ACP methyl ester carboxylesterase